VGGGYIACEFACIMNGLGVEVTQYYRGAQILRGFDGEARGLIAEMMEEKGVELACRHQHRRHGARLGGSRCVQDRDGNRRGDGRAR
jgi:pyruvate/2-oxoglutarate dehydrogenase complex dihydrolipoamide dehydrogenase (E3) component